MDSRWFEAVLGLEVKFQEVETLPRATHDQGEISLVQHYAIMYRVNLYSFYKVLYITTYPPSIPCLHIQSCPKSMILRYSYAKYLNKI
jgi:hypothetical protein